MTAPDGYILGTQTIEITVDSNTAYQIDAESGDVIIEADYEDHPVKGKLTVYKKGEVLTGFKDDFIYEERYLSGAEFEVYAAEDIYTPDHQKDAEGNRKKIYSEGMLVMDITTGEDGKAVVENLPLGTYRVVEKTAPDGFVKNTEGQEVTLAYAGQDTPVVEAELTFGDERQRVSITVEKQDAENGSVVAGAVFGIYNTEDIASADGEVIVSAGTLLQEMASGEDGLASCTLDLPLGQYYVKELKAPDGYVSSDEVLAFDASYDVYKGFDEATLQKIQAYLYPQEKAAPAGQKAPMENWQKAHENGEYLRSAEMSEESNYNMIDGLMNNKNAKKQPPGPKHRPSVLAKLRQKQKEIADRSGKMQEQKHGERNRN